jgi:NAD(P)H-nitrite reductase large subunit
MGKAAGINAVGDEYKYEGFVPSNAFSGMGTSLFSVGDNGKDPEKVYKTIEVYDGTKNTYEKFYFVNNKFCGGILIGDVSKTSKLLEARWDCSCKLKIIPHISMTIRNSN